MPPAGFPGMIWEIIKDRIPLLQSNNASPVNVQNIVTAPLILPMAQQLGLTTLSSDTAINDYTVNVTNATGMTVGKHFRIINSEADRFYAGTILNIAANVITLDSPLDFVYLSGSEVTYSNINLAVDGSGTPIEFHLRTGSPSIPSSVDIYKMTLVCETATPIDLNKFGDLPALTKGLLFRSENGVIHNIWNVKANRELVGLDADFQTFDSTHPVQGIDGFVWGLTFNGQTKMGVAIRIDQYGQLSLTVQDDLASAVSSAQIISLICILGGRVVQN